MTLSFKTSKPKTKMTDDFSINTFTFPSPDLNQLLQKVISVAEKVRKEKSELLSDDIDGLKNQLELENLTFLNVVKKHVESMLGSVDGLIGELEDVQSCLEESKRINLEKNLEIWELRQNPGNERFDQVVQQFNEVLEELVEAAQIEGVNVPWQVRYLAERNPGDGSVELQGGMITDADGNNIWESKCFLSGVIIQDGADGEGKARYHCQDNFKIDISVEYYDLFHQIYGVVCLVEDESLKEKALELLRDINPYLDVPFSLEYNHPVFLHVDIIEKPTLASRLNASFDLFANRFCLGTPLSVLDVEDSLDIYDGYAWHTYSKIGNLSRKLCTQLSGLQLGNRPSIGITSSNRVEWMLADFACTLSNMVSVGLHTTYQDNEITKVANNASLSCIIFGKNRRDQISNIIDDVPSLKVVICMDKLTIEEAKTFTDKKSITYYYFYDLIDSCTEIILPDLEDRNLNDIFTVMYTSGSTGTPKGVMVTEDIFKFDTGHAMNLTLINASYIPLSHSTDRMRIWETLFNGGRVGFVNYKHVNWIDHETVKKDELLTSLNHTTNGVEELIEQVSLLKPTIFVAPPRIWNGLYTIYQQYLNQNDKNSAIEYIRSLIGGRVLHLATGGSPSNPEVLEWIQNDLYPENVAFIESYGCTECGGISVNGNVMSGVQVELVDRPSLGYTTQDNPPRGELKVKSRTVVPGYWENPEDTSKTFIDGWFYTGDLCSIDEEGKITILGRVKSITTLPSGKTYAPTRLEAIYQSQPLIDHICIYNIEETLHAIISLDHNATTAWFQTHNEPFTLTSESLLQTLKHDLQEINSANNLRAFELPDHLTLTQDEWTLNNNMLTTSFKVIRKNVISHYIKP